MVVIDKTKSTKTNNVNKATRVSQKGFKDARDIIEKSIRGLYADGSKLDITCTYFKLGCRFNDYFKGEFLKADWREYQRPNFSDELNNYLFMF